VKNKMKTHKATAKRITPTGAGKFTHFKHSRNHRRRTNSGRISRAIDKKIVLSAGDAKKMTRLLPYG
jgi:large subunit ribosomal protein L35